MRDLVIIIPVLGRPHSVAPLWETWQATTDSAHMVMAVDEDDPTLEDYRAATASTNIELRVGPSEWTAPKLNSVVREYQGRYRYIGFWGDDNRPRTPGWDTTFTTELSRLGTGLVYANDLLQGENLPCSVAMTSDIPHTLGYMAFPGALHLCIDVAWKAWGQGLDRLTYLPDVVVEHLHAANGKAPVDDTYRKGNSEERVREDSAAYYTYRDNQLPADLESLRSLL